MWTMCCVENNDDGPVDKQDRFEFQSEVVDKLKELKDGGKVHMEDVLIFPPYADEETVTRRKSMKNNESASNFRYREQQEFINSLAAKHGITVSRPDYHAKPRDCNTVLFYLPEDEAHNRMVDKEPTRFTRCEAADKIRSGVHIDSKCVYRDAFFAFENSDANGHLDFGFANHGTIDLRDIDWRVRLEGAVMLAYATKKQNDYLRATGGSWALREADSVYNDLNREIIKYFLMRHGQAFLGSINFYDETRKQIVAGTTSVYEQYSGQKVYNFGCAFVVPVADEQLEKLIRDWNTDNRLPKGVDEVTKITSRITELGGLHLVWY